MSNKQVVLSSKKRYNDAMKDSGGNKVRDDNLSQTMNYTRDILEKMSDRDLSQAEHNLERRISSLRRENSKTQPQEVELCYVQDEIFRRFKIKSSNRRQQR